MNSDEFNEFVDYVSEKEYKEEFLNEKEIPKDILKQLKELMNLMKIASKNNQKAIVKHNLEKIEKIAKQYNISDEELGKIQYPKGE